MNNILVSISTLPRVFVFFRSYQSRVVIWFNAYVFPEDKQVYLLIIAPNVGSEILYHIDKTIFQGHKLWISHFICTAVPYVVPTIIAMVCVAVQTKYLGRLGRNNVRAEARSRRITITVLMMTTVFTICNTAHFSTLFALNSLKPTISLHDCYVLYTCGTILPLLNSCFNPIILLTRGSTLRQHFYSLAPRMSPPAGTNSTTVAFQMYSIRRHRIRSNTI